MEDIEAAEDDALLLRRRGDRRHLDSDYAEQDEGIENADEDSDDAPLDELEPENIIDAEEESRLKKQAKKNQKATTRRHRTEVEEANLMGDEQEETVFIDNLPNDECGIKSMLNEVRRNIMMLEKQFLMEEDSDAEEDEKLLSELQFDANIQ